MSRRMKPADPELTALKVVMLEKGIDSYELARLTGLKARNVQNILSGTNRCRKPRLKINRALGVEVFSDPKKPDEPGQQAAKRKPE